jgi:cytoskeletal protein CcmA (bactofilin family)
MRPLGEFDLPRRGKSVSGSFICLVALLLTVAALLMSPVTAMATETGVGDDANVAKSETIQDDLLLAGGDVDIAGTVQGDVNGAASKLDISGRVTGDVNVTVGQLKVSGTIGEALRTVGGEITISGTVNGDVLAVGGDIEVTSAGRVTGDLLALGGNVTLNGPVDGNIRGNMSDLTINSRVGQDVKVRVDDFTIENGARIAGDVTYRSHNDLNQASGAVINGSIEKERLVGFLPMENMTFWIVSAVFRLLCALVAGLFVVMIMPKSTAFIADAVRQSPLKSLASGFVLLVIMPVLIGILLVTVIGIPIALVGLAIFLVALYLSQVFVGTAIGRVILPDNWGNFGRGYNLLAMVIGVIIIAALRAIPVPYVGWVVTAIVTILGLGALIVGLSRRGRTPLGSVVTS